MIMNSHSTAKFVFFAILCAISLKAKGADVIRTPYGWSFPNPQLTDQDGKKVRFYEDLVKGKIVLINFIFTTCDAYCPMDTARLKKVQDLVGDRMGKDIFFYSVSIDPVADSPHILRAYRKRFGAGPGWTFLTGDEADITAMRKGLGLYTEGFEKSKSDHSQNIMVGNDSSGEWMRRSNMDKSIVMAKLLTDRLSGWKNSVGVANDFAKAPTRLKDIPKGQDIFNSRCMDCHTIGGGDGLGPDLKDVFRTRDAAWLKSWILAPNKMLEAKDPIAIALLHQFNGVIMPNLSLPEGDVDEVIDFLRSEVTQLDRNPKNGERKR